MSLYHALKAHGCKYGTSYELATLGVLAMLPVSEERIISDFLEVDQFLQKQSGYGFFGCISRRERYMHASMIVTSSYVDDCSMVGTTMNSAAISGTISLVTAQQAATCAAIAASHAAASATNAANN